MPADGVWNFLLWLHYLGLALWIGGIIMITAVAIPAAHRSMASKAVAAEIVRGTLKKLNMVEMTCCLLLLVTTVSSFRFVQQRHLLYELIFGIVLMGLITIVYAFQLTPQLERLRESTPTLDSLSENHETKKEFLRIHKLYVRLMSVNLVLGLAVLYGSVVILK
jgi:uncharacterized membrane protein